MSEEFWSFDDCEGPVSEERVSYIEEIIGIKFPKFYKDLVKQCDGGTLLKDEFDYYDEYYEEILSGSISVFLRLNESCSYESVLKCFYEPAEFFPENTLAFGRNGGGNLVCFDYREGKDNLNPPIVYWRHGADEGKDVSFIAPNFDAFIKMLYRSEDED